jgi:hypothetical protein
MKRRLPVVASVSVGLWLSGNQVCACATCYGASDAPMAHGMNMGILVLLLVVASVLSGIAACYWESGVGVRR